MGSNGKLTGYLGGSAIATKQALLRLESRGTYGTIEKSGQTAFEFS
jgi:hypothetical protein